MQRVTHATATKKAGGKHKRGPVRSLRLEKAENGVVSNVDFEPAADAKDEEKYGPHLSATTVHTKLDDLLSHVKEHTAGFFPKGKPAKGEAAADGTPAHEKAETKGQEAAEQAEGDEDEEED
jgi:hypothetical protein